MISTVSVYFGLSTIKDFNLIKKSFEKPMTPSNDDTFYCLVTELLIVPGVSLMTSPGVTRVSRVTRPVTPASQS